MSKQYDVIVFGAGPGGYYAAIRAAQLGLKSAVIEKDRLGGTCANYGCIPTKSYYFAAKMLEQSRHAEKFGLKGQALQPDMKAIVARKDGIVKKLNAGIAMLLKKNKVDLYEGAGAFVSKTEVEVTSGKGGEKLHAKNIIIATGSLPVQIPGVRYDAKHVLTSTDILALQEIPESLIIVGGGVIGLEMAGIFNSFGSKVTVVEMLPEIIPMEDKEISAFMRKELTAKGIEILTGAKVEKAETADGKIKVKISQSGTSIREMQVSHVLISVGRKSNIEGLGLEKIGLDPKARSIQVNDKMMTTVPGVYAIGDVNGRSFLAYTASAQGILAAEHIAGKNTHYDESVVPNCIWSNPEVASVGLKEEDARKKGFDIAVGKFPFAASGKAMIIGETGGFVKVIVDKKFEQILGVHIVGPEATLLIAEAAMALRCEATVEEFDRISHSHPTLSEAIMEAAHNALGKSIDY